MAYEERESSVADQNNKNAERKIHAEIDTKTAEGLRSILGELKGHKTVEPGGEDILLGQLMLLELPRDSPIAIYEEDSTIMVAVRLRAPWDEDDTSETYEIRLASPTSRQREHEWIIEIDDDEDQLLVDRYIKQEGSPDHPLSKIEAHKLIHDVLNALELGSSVSRRESSEPGQQEAAALLALLKSYKSGFSTPK